MTTAQTDRGTDGDGRTPGRPGPHDFLNVDAHLSEEEKAVRAEARAFVEDRIRPNIRDWFERARFPRELVPEMGALGLLGMHLKGYGCAGKSAVAYGLACMELEAGDSGLRTFVSVQGSLAMSAIHKFGSEEQKERWLPPMARGEAIGCFGLTEPTAGSDPASMKTFARREGSDWILNGSKRWIGMGTIADVAVVWARTGEEGNPVRGFLVPTDAPRLHGQRHNRQAVHASLGAVRPLLRGRPSPRRGDAARRRGPQGSFRVPQRGALRYHLGLDGRGERLVRVRTGVCE